MDYKIEIVLQEKDDFSDFLRDKIRTYNNSHSVYHRESREEGSVQPVHIILSDDTNNWIGGLTGQVYWQWFEVDKFWISDVLRGKGLGRTVLEKAEQLAKDKGATKALLTTFEFQARTFYEKWGYRVVGEVKDYPPGSTYYTMVKSL